MPVPAAFHHPIVHGSFRFVDSGRPIRETSGDSVGALVGLRPHASLHRQDREPWDRFAGKGPVQAQLRSVNTAGAKARPTAAQVAHLGWVSPSPIVSMTRLSGATVRPLAMLDAAMRDQAPRYVCAVPPWSPSTVGHRIDTVVAARSRPANGQHSQCACTRPSCHLATTMCDRQRR